VIRPYHEPWTRTWGMCGVRHSNLSCATRVLSFLVPILAIHFKSWSSLGINSRLHTLYPSLYPGFCPMSEFSVLRIPGSRPDGQTRVHAHTCPGLRGLEMISCTVGNALGSQIIYELETPYDPLFFPSIQRFLTKSQSAPHRPMVSNGVVH